MCSPCNRVLCWVLGLWCLERGLCFHVVVMLLFSLFYDSHCVRELCWVFEAVYVVMLFVVVSIVLCALIALEYNVWSSVCCV